MRVSGLVGSVSSQYCPSRTKYTILFSFLPVYLYEASLFVFAVVYAYEQCLQTMGFHPNIWCEAALYLEKVSQKLMDKGVN